MLQIKVAIKFSSLRRSVLRQPGPLSRSLVSSQKPLHSQEAENLRGGNRGHVLQCPLCLGVSPEAITSPRKREPGEHHQGRRSVFALLEKTVPLGELQGNPYSANAGEKCPLHGPRGLFFHSQSKGRAVFREGRLMESLLCLSPLH